MAGGGSIIQLFFLLACALFASSSQASNLRHGQGRRTLALFRLDALARRYNCTNEEGNLVDTLQTIEGKNANATAKLKASCSSEESRIAAAHDAAVKQIDETEASTVKQAKAVAAAANKASKDEFDRAVAGLAAAVSAARTEEAAAKTRLEASRRAFLKANEVHTQHMMTITGEMRIANETRAAAEAEAAETHRLATESYTTMFTESMAGNDNIKAASLAECSRAFRDQTAVLDGEEQTVGDIDVMLKKLNMCSKQAMEGSTAAAVGQDLSSSSSLLEVGSGSSTCVQLEKKVQQLMRAQAGSTSTTSTSNAAVFVEGELRFPTLERSQITQPVLDGLKVALLMHVPGISEEDVSIAIANEVVASAATVAAPVAAAPVAAAPVAAAAAGSAAGQGSAVAAQGVSRSSSARKLLSSSTSSATTTTTTTTTTTGVAVMFAIKVESTTLRETTLSAVREMGATPEAMATFLGEAKAATKDNQFPKPCESMTIGNPTVSSINLIAAEAAVVSANGKVGVLRGQGAGTNVITLRKRLAEERTAAADAKEGCDTKAGVVYSNATRLATATRNDARRAASTALDKSLALAGRAWAEAEAKLGGREAAAAAVFANATSTRDRASEAHTDATAATSERLNEESKGTSSAAAARAATDGKAADKLSKASHDAALKATAGRTAAAKTKDLETANLATMCAEKTVGLNDELNVVNAVRRHLGLLKVVHSAVPAKPAATTPKPTTTTTTTTPKPTTTTTTTTTTTSGNPTGMKLFSVGAPCTKPDECDHGLLCADPKKQYGVNSCSPGICTCQPNCRKQAPSPNYYCLQDDVCKVDSSGARMCDRDTGLCQGNLGNHATCGGLTAPVIKLDGGACTTRHGCCLDRTTAKADASGTNCVEYEPVASSLVAQGKLDVELAALAKTREAATKTHEDAKRASDEAKLAAEKAKVLAEQQADEIKKGKAMEKTLTEEEDRKLVELKAQQDTTRLAELDKVSEHDVKQSKYLAEKELLAKKAYDEACAAWSSTKAKEETAKKKVAAAKEKLTEEQTKLAAEEAKKIAEKKAQEEAVKAKKEEEMAKAVAAEKARVAADDELKAKDAAELEALRIKNKAAAKDEEDKKKLDEEAFKAQTTAEADKVKAKAAAAAASEEATKVRCGKRVGVRALLCVCVDVLCVSVEQVQY